MKTIPPLSRLMARFCVLLILALILLCASVAAIAAPHLYADPYPATGVQPDAVTMTVNGGAPITCELETVAAGIRPKCDLASITADGTYTLVMTATKTGGIVNGPNGATNTVGSSASSAPFAYTLIRANVSAPGSVRVAP